jgi:hypothetical protein
VYGRLTARPTPNDADPVRFARDREVQSDRDQLFPDEWLAWAEEP